MDEGETSDDNKDNDVSHCVNRLANTQCVCVEVVYSSNEKDVKVPKNDGNLPNFLYRNSYL